MSNYTQANDTANTPFSFEIRSVSAVDTPLLSANCDSRPILEGYICNSVYNDFGTGLVYAADSYFTPIPGRISGAPPLPEMLDVAAVTDINLAEGGLFALAIASVPGIDDPGGSSLQFGDLDALDAAQLVLTVTDQIPEASSVSLFCSAIFLLLAVMKKPRVARPQTQDGYNGAEANNLTQTM